MNYNYAVMDKEKYQFYGLLSEGQLDCHSTVKRFLQEEVLNFEDHPDINFWVDLMEVLRTLSWINIRTISLKKFGEKCDLYNIC